MTDSLTEALTVYRGTTRYDACPRCGGLKTHISKHCAACSYLPGNRGHRKPTQSLADRFWAKVDRSGECWTWTAGRFGAMGYGSLRVAGRNVTAHRISWQLANGPIPEGRFVLHHCDNPPCVRPDHLYLGDAKDNARDMWSRGRARDPHSPSYGEANGRSKLTAETVAEMRRLHSEGVSASEIGRRFGVHNGTAGRAIRGQTWTS